MKMKKLIFKYLDKTYPTAYVIECKFGHYPSFKGELFTSHKLIGELMDMFGSEEKEFIKSIVSDWLLSLPVVCYIKNTTNPNVLIFK